MPTPTEAKKGQNQPVEVTVRQELVADIDELINRVKKPLLVLTVNDINKRDNFSLIIDEKEPIYNELPEDEIQRLFKLVENFIVEFLTNWIPKTTLDERDFVDLQVDRLIDDMGELGMQDGTQAKLVVIYYKNKTRLIALNRPSIRPPSVGV